MYTTNELMFPHDVLPHLRDARGDAWRDLIDRLSQLPETHEDVLALMLLMIRLNGCMPCETDSYRAMRGCTMCTLQTLRRYKEPDSELLRIYDEALQDVQEYLAHPDIPVRMVDYAMEGV